MTDLDIDALLDEEDAPPSAALVEMAGLADRLREALSRTEGVDLARATPKQRQEIADFRDMLLDWMEPMKVWLSRIEHLWRLAGEETGATEFPLFDGRVVKLEEPPTTYAIQEQQLRTALLTFVRDGLLTQDDVDKAITPMTVYKVNNTNLNTLHRKRGKRVADAIEQYRHKVETTASQAKVVYPRRSR